jgi:hypothetical protein
MFFNGNPSWKEIKSTKNAKKKNELNQKNNFFENFSILMKNQNPDSFLI